MPKTFDDWANEYGCPDGHRADAEAAWNAATANTMRAVEAAKSVLVNLTLPCTRADMTVARLDQIVMDIANCGLADVNDILEGKKRV